jgi:hypothetical protein
LTQFTAAAPPDRPVDTLVVAERDAPLVATVAFVLAAGLVTLVEEAARLLGLVAAFVVLSGAALATAVAEPGAT